MAKQSRIDEIEERISMEIIVDAYGPEEISMGWYYYLDDTLNFPFLAQWLSTSKKENAKGDRVEVIGMAEEEDCTSEMVCEVAFEGDEFSVPLVNIIAPDADEKTQEAIADWHYWMEQGYSFD